MAEAGKDKKGLIYLVVGVILILLGMFADALGLGVVSGIGYKQVVLLIVGVAFLYLGIKSCKCAPKQKQ